MTKLEELKNSILNKTLTDDVIVFLIKDNDFICNQYIKEISNIKKKPVEYISTLVSSSLFFDDVSTSISVYRCDELSSIPNNFFDRKNLFIITKKVSVDVGDNLYEVPKMEDWQIKDYVYSLLDNINQNKLNDLIDKCKNIYRLDSEISKLTLFNPIERPALYDIFLEDGVFNDLSKFSIFDLTNAILKKDKNKIISVYKEKSCIDIEPIGFTTILINSFRDVISVQFDPRVTAEDLGVAKNKFWAIKYNCGFYSQKELLEIFKMLCSIDFLLKTGKLDASLIIDYVIINILKYGD